MTCVANVSEPERLRIEVFYHEIVTGNMEKALLNSPAPSHLFAQRLNRESRLRGTKRWNPNEFKYRR
jgi:hypothetical protein